MTNAELAARLLREAAAMFRVFAEPHPDLGERLEESADIYEQAAELLETDPTGSVGAPVERV